MCPSVDSLRPELWLNLCQNLRAAAVLPWVHLREREAMRQAGSRSHTWGQGVCSPVRPSQAFLLHSLANRTILFWFFLERWSFSHNFSHPPCCHHLAALSLQLKPQFKLWEKRKTVNSPPHGPHFQSLTSLHNLPPFVYFSSYSGSSFLYFVQLF